MSGLQFTLILYAIWTAVFAGMQAVENRTSKRGDTYWAPVWWIALTWPWWVATTLTSPLRRH
jgi:hypothetical protein